MPGMEHRDTNGVQRQPPREKSEEPVTVLVTGFGPFLTQIPKNTSWEIASRLPALIPADDTNPTPIHIYVHHEPIRVAYDTVTSLVPTLLPPASPQNPAPSIILHIGLAASRRFFALETCSHSRGYDKIRDVDGRVFSDKAAESLFPAERYPPVLETSFDTADVLERWKGFLQEPGATASVVGFAQSAMPTPDVRLSNQAGNFMCGFIYWMSLAHYYSIREEERPVVFLHVPDLSWSTERMEMGRDVVVALIKALVESRRQVGVVDRGVRRSEVSSQKAEERRAATDVNFA
ncbi:peptidase C15, pyroglutamyl peptidase I-like protein [Westerdykella ornata]|uniref:Peptidase C15, pyroglutamyl peptidase I-like protein n=1 Tax=Westerdykella ornata TaxID=318751 RepID=A0A6A6JRF3_WESOR|nr:peptidase C15, pyroglutamyl peptidase I-like protein [Westerdykella ornata]KAF2278306.1 peptidase C15, pyroglutamyl peptidase I-like protein [Westerdykella ornata]